MGTMLEAYNENRCWAHNCEGELQPLPKDFEPMVFEDPSWGWFINRLCPDCGRGYGVDNEGHCRMAVPNDVYDQTGRMPLMNPYEKEFPGPNIDKGNLDIRSLR